MQEIRFSSRAVMGCGVSRSCKRLVSAALFVLLGTVASLAAAGEELNGAFRPTPLREEIRLENWEGGCGAPPEGKNVGGAELVRVRTVGGELVFEGGDHPFRTSSCYDSRASSRDAHTRDASGMQWKSRCSGATADGKALGSQTTVTATADRIDLTETLRMEWKEGAASCRVVFQRSRSYSAIAPAAVVPTATAAPPPTSTPTSSSCSPGPVARVEFRLAKRVVVAGASLPVELRAFDSAGCPSQEDVAWTVSPSGRGVTAERRSVVTTSSATLGRYVLSARIGAKEETSTFEVTDEAHLQSLLGEERPVEDVQSNGETRVGPSPQEVSVKTRGAARRNIFLGVIGTLILGLGAAWVVARRRDQEKSRASKDTAVGDLEPAQDAARDHLVPAIAEAGPKKCPLCGKTFRSPIAYCQDDGTLLVDEAKAETAFARCPVCGRGFEAGTGKCPEHGEELVPFRVATASAREKKGKICPTCGDKFEGSADFCGKDGTHLVLLN